MWIGNKFSEVIFGGQSLHGKDIPRGISPMPADLTELMTGNTTAYRNFLAFDDFRIVCAPLRRETPERLVEAGQFERGDCGCIS